ncbi:hypothetical protein HC026_01540 [Lactobacillus sp. LC28-10]|uniref:Polyprenyl synthetase n=1 Tax=Secundilactobacillus angelensis TaxID=2722706 RepID=A0ABX1KUJ9_9LACO|nr:hypothetical protein [Secundilactobacillus angelensis]MCH5461207.1 hypothetical protein [Secundilactobacillus angelensis]NLR17597.1 hypothetical protein [Secundilactobacillus angelensis]
MAFNANNYTVDVALEDDFQSWLSQQPAVVKEPAKTVANDQHRHFRQALWTLFCQSKTDRHDRAEQSSGTVEALALASGLIPATFRPRQLSLSDVAMAKAQAYSSQYLYGYVVANIAAAELPHTEATTLLQTAQNFWLASTARLQLNFNQRERVADYLKDAKARSGALGAMTCRLAAVVSGTTDRAITDLISTIGETLGVIEQILTTVNKCHDSLDFKTLIMSGNYPLSLLFALEEEGDWFDTFFKATTKPTPDQFEIARKLTIQTGEQSAIQLAKELVNQTQLDAKALPEGSQREPLTNLLQQLENDCHYESSHQ